MSLIFLLNVIAIAIITLAVFTKRRGFDLKMKHLKLSILFFALFQMGLIVLGVVLYLLIGNSLGKDGSLSLITIVVLTAVIVALVMSLVISNKAMKRKYLREN